MFRAYLDSIADLDPRVAELYTQDENGRYLLNVEELVDRLNIHDDDRYVLNTEQVIDRIVAYDPDYLNHAELTAQPLMARIVYARIDFIHRTGELPTDVYFSPRCFEILRLEIDRIRLANRQFYDDWLMRGRFCQMTCHVSIEQRIPCLIGSEALMSGPYKVDGVDPLLLVSCPSCNQEHPDREGRHVNFECDRCGTRWSVAQSRTTLPLPMQHWRSDNAPLKELADAVSDPRSLSTGWPRTVDAETRIIRRRIALNDDV